MVAGVGVLGYVFCLPFECFVPPDELEELAGKREVWASLLGVLPL